MNKFSYERPEFDTSVSQARREVLRQIRDRKESIGDHMVRVAAYPNFEGQRQWRKELAILFSEVKRFRNRSFCDIHESIVLRVVVLNALETANEVADMVYSAIIYMDGETPDTYAYECDYLLLAIKLLDDPMSLWKHPGDVKSFLLT